MVYLLQMFQKKEPLIKAARVLLLRAIGLGVLSYCLFDTPSEFDTFDFILFVDVSVYCDSWCDHENDEDGCNSYSLFHRIGGLKKLFVFVEKNYSEKILNHLSCISFFISGNESCLSHTIIPIDRVNRQAKISTINTIGAAIIIQHQSRAVRCFIIQDFLRDKIIRNVQKNLVSILNMIDKHDRQAIIVYNFSDTYTYHLCRELCPFYFL